MFDQFQNELADELRTAEARYGGELTAGDLEVLFSPAPAANASGGLAAHRGPPTWLAALAWTLFGASLLALAIWALDRSGVILLRTDSAGFTGLASLEDAIAYLAEPAQASLQAMEKTAEAVKADLASGALKADPDKSRTLHNVANLYPDLFRSFQASLPKGATVLVLLSADGGFKVVTRSEACQWIVQNHPDMVDPARSYYPGSCQWYGIWNENGRNL